MQLDGIDTSHHQDLTGQPLPPLKFAITKASQGVSFKDPECAQLLARFRQDGAHKIGCYHFVDPVGTAAQQFANFTAVCSANGPLDFVMIDWEREPNSQKFPPLQTVLDFEVLCQQRWPGRVFVYSAPWVTGFSTWLARPGHSPLWYPNYSTNGTATALRLGAVIRQYTDAASLSAFAAPLDGNTIIDQPAWDAMFGTQPEPTPAPPIAIPEEDDEMNLVTINCPGDTSRPQFIAGFGINGWRLASPAADGATIGQLRIALGGVDPASQPSVWGCPPANVSADVYDHILAEAKGPEMVALEAATFEPQPITVNFPDTMKVEVTKLPTETITSS